MKNTLRSEHWLAMFFTFIFPAATVVMVLALDAAAAVKPSFTSLHSLYIGVSVWWLFGIIAGITPDYPKHRPRFIGWILLLPVAAIVLNLFTNEPPYTERLVWFNSLVVTWIGFVFWIATDWYRWKYNPSKRQQRQIDFRLWQDKRRAEIDAVPNCVVPYGLQYSTTE